MPDSSSTEQSIDLPFTFTRRASPLPADLRPAYRLAILVLIIEHCRGGKASVEQLHVLDWSIRTAESRHLFIDFINGKKTPSDIIIRYDPSLSRAIDFALAEALITQREAAVAGKKAPSTSVFRFSLTTKGKAVLKELMGMDDCLEEEKIFLEDIGTRITQEQIRGLFKWGS
jgi:hypothetical protein